MTRNQIDTQGPLTIHSTMEPSEEGRCADKQADHLKDERVFMMGNVFVNTIDVEPVAERLAAGEEFTLGCLFINGQYCPMHSGLKITVRATGAPHQPALQTPPDIGCSTDELTVDTKLDNDDNASRDNHIAAFSGVIDYLPTAKLFLKRDFDRNKLASLIAKFRPAVKRGCDLRLADQLEADLLTVDGPRLRTPTIRRLARWCKTDRIYADRMEIAKEISLLLFGQVVDRTRLGI